MSRSKKSRKPSAFDINPIREERKPTENAEPRKPKKSKGKKAGNRQQEAFQDKNGKNQKSNANVDPRLGSKKPIVLTAEPSKQNKKTPTAPKSDKKIDTPIAKIRVVEADDALRDELYAIEDDAQLQSIIAKQEEEITLSESEVDYFNAKMERHLELSEILGLNDEDEDDTEESDVKSNDEDDLWDKLDSSDLSKFE